MPRRTTDFDGVNDRVHPALEKAEQRLAEDFRDKSCETRSLDVPPDEERRPRSREEMEEEARWLSSLFGKEGQSS
jgi:bis(5'-adenosyl)-triphosphatase